LKNEYPFPASNCKKRKFISQKNILKNIRYSPRPNLQPTHQQFFLHLVKRFVNTDIDAPPITVLSA